MAITPAYTGANVLVGQARMFTQPYVAAVPPALPPVTTLIGGSWAPPWTAVGATTDGLTFQFSRKTIDITIEEQSTPVAITTDTTTFEMDVELSEDTLNTMLLAYGGGTITTTAATSTNPALQTLQIAPDLGLFSFGFEGQNEFGFYRRVLVPIVVSVAQAKTKYSRAKAQRSYAVQFRSIVDPSQVVIQSMTAVHT